MEDQTNHFPWTINSSASLVQACHWYFSIWRSCILTNYGLYKQISKSVQAHFNDRHTCCKSMQVSVSEYGWPDSFISDNDPCYTLQNFTNVMQAFSVNHITSSPHYPQSNGLAEKYVQIVKCLFNKTKEKGKDFHKCLMIYQNTPLTGSMAMAMQILQGRSARSD